MAKKVSIHPYKGYLNTKFQIYSHEQTPVEYVVYSKDNGTEVLPPQKKGWLNQISLILLDCPHQVLLLYNSVTELQVK